MLSYEINNGARNNTKKRFNAGEGFMVYDLS